VSAPADDFLAALVRNVLPKPYVATHWQVEVVDTIEQVDAEANGQAAIVRIHKSWRETVYDVGLCQVTRHCPLALEPVRDQDVPVDLLAENVSLWRAVTIEREYWRGQFTGALTVGEAYVARTFDEIGRFADADIVVAARSALSGRRQKLNETNIGKKRLAARREQTSELLRQRLSRPADYDRAHCVSLEPFYRLLPARISKMLELNGGHKVPLIALEQESVHAVLEIPESHMSALIYQLDLAINAAP
jgi:hypothetical protein